MKQAARRGQLSIDEFSAPLHSLSKMREHARDSYIAYLKSSGERISDLVSMSDDELRKWYGIVKKQNDKQKEMYDKRRAEVEQQRRAQKSNRR